MAENKENPINEAAKESKMQVTSKIQFGKYLRRLRNPAVVMGLAGYTLTICGACGIKVDNETVYTVLQALSGIFILLGIMNNPDKQGCDVPKINNNSKGE